MVLGQPILDSAALYLGSRVPCGTRPSPWLSSAQLRMLRLVLGRIDPLLFLFASVHPYRPAPKSIHRARVPPLPIATLPHEYRRDCLEPARIPSHAPPLYGGLTGHLRLADFDLSVKLTRGQRRFSFVCAHRPSRASIHPPRRAGAKAEVPQRWLLATCRSARRSTCLPRSCTAKATTLALIGGGWAS